MDDALAIWAGAADRYASISPAVKELTGHPARSFTQWARDHAADFR